MIPSIESPLKQPSSSSLTKPEPSGFETSDQLSSSFFLEKWADTLFLREQGDSVPLEMRRANVIKHYL